MNEAAHKSMHDFGRDAELKSRPLAFLQHAIEQTGAKVFLWISMAACLFTVLLVNPLREVSLEDDWNFALMVRHLLETGEYRLHEWLAPNLPFQTYWGGLFAYAFGFSFTSLRASTLVVMAAGLVAFYFLGREHGLSDAQSGLITLGLLASPLFVLHSFTFNTDVPFLMYFVIALLFYTRAIARHSYPLMFLASIAASAAILTRQFGVAIPAGVFALWLLRKEHRKQPALFAAGLLLPAIAGAWQLSMGVLAPTKLQWREMHLLSLYFADKTTLLTNTIFRPAIILEYLALFSLPFVFPALAAIGYELFSGNRVAGGSTSARSRTVLLGAIALYVAAGIIHAHVVNHTPWLMPYLIWDYFDFAHM
ncbi:MAG TPA: glycosyltransferase family 39 protein, partial [Nitrospira sp.]|nr:glycosyltransferase family 39 protein [Nitrospira sp.]